MFEFQKGLLSLILSQEQVANLNHQPLIQKLLPRPTVDKSQRTEEIKQLQ